MMALAFTTVPTNGEDWVISLQIRMLYELTGEKGYFDTRIIYVAKKDLKQKKKLAIMDQDGANNKFLTLNELVLTPRFNQRVRW